MIKQLKAKLLKEISNIPGWCTNERIVVIESDDWGSERFPNKWVIGEFKSNGYNIDLCGFSSFDCLESEEDLESIIDVLHGFMDFKGNRPVLTMLCNCSNPDYEKIEYAGFDNYHSKSLFQSHNENADKIRKIYKEGIRMNLLLPQFHGREHLYVDRWLRDLKTNSETRYAFTRRVSGISTSYMNGVLKGYRAAFDLDIEADLNYQTWSISQGVKEFQEFYTIAPTYFVPPDGPFNNSLEPILRDNGIKFIGASKVQKEPLGSGRYSTHFHWLGKMNNHNQLYITRNVAFEPLSKLYPDPVSKALAEIESAFRWKKPAVISTHRANYVGGIEASNREKGLESLKRLIIEILKKWPDVQFMSSVELGKFILKDKGVQSEAYQGEKKYKN